MAHNLNFYIEQCTALRKANCELKQKLDDMHTKSDERDKKIIDEAQRYGYALRVWVNENIAKDEISYNMTYDEAVKAKEEGAK
jgi:hypothetical protein